MTIGYAGKSACSMKLWEERESDARQHEQSRERQAEQQERQNHENDAHGLEMRALSNSRNQRHGGQENRDMHVLVSGLAGFCILVGYLGCLFTQTKKLLVLRVMCQGIDSPGR